MNKVVKEVRRVKVEGYLTEDKLHSILCTVFGDENVIRQALVEDTKLRIDFKVSKNGKDLYVEFDGDSHYRDPKVILRDAKKSMFSPNLIRIPYWVQLNTETFKYWFGSICHNEKIEIETDFPHGFVSKSCVLPSSFCELGVSRFLTEYDHLPDAVRREVFNSLKDKLNEFENSVCMVITSVIANRLFGRDLDKYYNEFNYIFKRDVFISNDCVSGYLVKDVVDHMRKDGLEIDINSAHIFSLLRSYYGVITEFSPKGDIVDITIASLSPSNVFKGNTWGMLAVICQHAAEGSYIWIETLNRCMVFEPVNGVIENDVKKIPILELKYT